MLGIVEYLNALPIVHALKRAHIPFSTGTPAELNHRLRKKELSSALTSSVEYLDGEYQLGSNLCIAAEKEIISVNLYKKGPLRKVALTPESATSVALLKVLCHHHWKVDPTFVPLGEEEVDAFLLIGDVALEKQEIPGYETVDLATAWYEMTGLPFVFALFAQHKEDEQSYVKLEHMIQWDAAIVEEAHRKSGFPKPLLERYYRLCRYHLGEREREGLALFDTLRHKVSL